MVLPWLSLFVPPKGVLVPAFRTAGCRSSLAFINLLARADTVGVFGINIARIRDLAVELFCEAIIFGWLSVTDGD